MKNYMLLLFLIFPIILTVIHTSNKFSAFAEDAVLDESEDNEVDIDEDLSDIETDNDAVTGDGEETVTSTSPYANTILLFTKPAYTPGQQLELPGGHPVEFLIGFINKGPNVFVIESIEASFRYPMDFNYHIQNFSEVTYNREVKSGIEATFFYSFLPSDQFAGRPFGLNVALNYRDVHGIQYSEAVFNETVMISELDDGLDGETFFLYVLLAGIVVLLLVIGQQYLLGTSGKRKRAAAKKVIETGTSNDATIDYEWIPQETMRGLQQSSTKNMMKTSPKPIKNNNHIKQNQSPKSPKQKKSVKQH